MGLLWTILIGFLVGTLAQVLVGTKDRGGFIITTLLGIAGSWVGGMLFGLIGLSPRVGFIGSLIGAVVILYLYRWLKNRG